jgi:hypothetical protein
MVPKRFPSDPKLGCWVHTQRIQYRKLMQSATNEIIMDTAAAAAVMVGMNMEEGINLSAEEQISYRLTEERRKRLEEVGFVWSARDEQYTEQGRLVRNSYDDLWDCMFNRLVDFKSKNGHCLVPKRYKDDNRLGTWVDTQRVQYKKMKKRLASQRSYDEGVVVGVSRLTDERIHRLEALGFVWSLRDDWQKHYDELIDYKREHGHCNVPARFALNRRLGIWVSAQRQQFKALMQASDDSKPRRSTLTQERIDLLNDLDFTWTIRSKDSLGETWNMRYQELKEVR